MHTEVEINHNIPGGGTGVKGATETEDFAGKHPPDSSNGVASLVVGGDGNVNVLSGGVGVAEGNDGDVHVGCLPDGLSVGSRVCNDNEAGLLERARDIVGEGAGGEATGNGSSTSVGGKLEDSTLAVGAGRYHTNVGRIVDGDDDAGGKDELLPTARAGLWLGRATHISKRKPTRSCQRL